MGLFDSDYRLTGSLQTSDLADPDQQINPLKDAILSAIFENAPTSVSPRFQQPQIMTNIIGAYLNNYSINVDRLLNYVEAYEQDFGTATLRIDRETQFTSALAGEFYQEHLRKIEAIIEAEIGEPVTIDQFAYDYPRREYFLIETVRSSADLRLNARGEFGSSRWEEQYTITDLTGVLERPEYGTIQEYDYYGEPDGEPYFVDQFGPPLATYRPVNEIISLQYPEQTYKAPLNGPIDGAFARVYLTELNGGFDVQLTISDVASFKANTWLQQAIYTLDSTKDVYAWIYDEADDTYPEIFLGPDFQKIDTILPTLYIANDNKYAFEGQMGNDYKEAVQSALKYIGLDLGDMHEALVPEGNSDANYDKVEDAFIHLSANLNSETQAELQYLYDYFRSQRYDADWPIYGANTSARRTNFRIRWGNIRVFTGTGTVDNLGGITGWAEDAYTIDPDPNHNGKISRINGVEVGKVVIEAVPGAETGDINNILGGASTGIQGHSNSEYRIYKQISETQVIRVTVFNFYRLDNYLKKVDGKWEIRSIVYNDVSDLDTNNLIIPLSTFFLEKYDRIIRSEILYAGLKFSVRAQDVTEIKWYEKSDFWKVIRFIVAVVTLGGSEINGFGAFIQQIIYQYVLSLLLTQLFKLVVEIFGLEAAIIIAAVTAYYALTMEEGEKLFELITAEELLLSSQALLGASNIVISEQLATLQQERELYLETLQDSYDELEKLEDELGLNSRFGDQIYDYLYQRPMLDRYENPEDFFNRTVHINNPGVLSLDSIDTYVSRNLELPQLDDQEMA